MLGHSIFQILRAPNITFRLMYENISLLFCFVNRKIGTTPASTAEKILPNVP